MASEFREYYVFCEFDQAHLFQGIEVSLWQVRTRHIQSPICPFFNYKSRQSLGILVLCTTSSICSQCTEKVNVFLCMSLDLLVSRCFLSLVYSKVLCLYGKFLFDAYIIWLLRFETYKTWLSASSADFFYFSKTRTDSFTSTRILMLIFLNKICFTTRFVIQSFYHPYDILVGW